MGVWSDVVEGVVMMIVVMVVVDGMCGDIVVVVGVGVVVMVVVWQRIFPGMSQHGVLQLHVGGREKEVLRSVAIPVQFY